MASQAVANATASLLKTQAPRVGGVAHEAQAKTQNQTAGEATREAPDARAGQPGKILAQTFESLLRDAKILAQTCESLLRDAKILAQTCESPKMDTEMSAPTCENPEEGAEMSALICERPATDAGTNGEMVAVTGALMHNDLATGAGMSALICETPVMQLEGNLAAKDVAKGTVIRESLPVRAGPVSVGAVTAAAAKAAAKGVALKNAAGHARPPAPQWSLSAGPRAAVLAVALAQRAARHPGGASLGTRIESSRLSTALKG